MIAFLAGMAKAAGYAAHAGFFGGIIFLFLAGPAEDPCSLRWRRRIVGAFPWLAAGYAVALLAAGLTEASSAAGVTLTGILGQPDRLRDFALGTRVGLVATLRLAAALLMLLAAIAIVRFKKGSAAALAVMLLLAAIAAIPGAFASHAAGDDQASYLMPAYIVHVLAMASWAGGLPAWIALGVDGRQRPGGIADFPVRGSCGAQILVTRDYLHRRRCCNRLCHGHKLRDDARRPARHSLRRSFVPEGSAADWCAGGGL